MRPTAPPPKQSYVFQEYPCVMYPNTEMLAQGLIRIKTAKSAEEEKEFTAIGYQRTQAEAPAIAPTATKEEALAKQKEQFDAAWDKKVAELATVKSELENLQKYMASLQSDRDRLAKRLAEVTERMATEKKAAKEEKVNA